MELNRPSKFWTAFGKIALVVTVLAGVVQLVRTVVPPNSSPDSKEESKGARLVGRLRPMTFDLPPDIASLLAKAKNLTSYETADKFTSSRSDTTYDKFLTALSPSIDDLLGQLLNPKKTSDFAKFEQALKKDPENAKRFKGALNQVLVGVLRDYAAEAWDRNLYRAPKYDSYVLLDIENTGEKQAVSVEVQLPHEGIYLLEEPGEKPIEKTFKSKIPIGTILPKNSKRLRLWTEMIVRTSPYELEKWRLTSADGPGQVIFWHSD